jgi:lipopolysaccharide export system permease protein
VTILWRYLARTWLGVFATAMASAAALYLVIDVFDRIGEVLQYSPSWASLLSYFLFKLPKILYDVFPAASLLATLVSIGMLSRSNEILAMRACGMGMRRIALPLVATAFVASVVALAWSEAVIPVSSTRSRWLWDVELKRKTYRGVFDAASLWFQTGRGFVHIRRYDADGRVIEGLSLYESDADFGLRRVVEVDTMRWQDGRWTSSGGFVKEIGTEELAVRPLAPSEFELDEDPDNLAARKRRPEEFSWLQLRRLIGQMEARGLGADDYLVDLHHKLAWPFAGFIVALLGVPVALRSARESGIARGTAIGLVIGFSYWIVTGLALSAGRTEAVSPLAAAWAANLIFGGVAVLLIALRIAR